MQHEGMLPHPAAERSRELRASSLCVHSHLLTSLTSYAWRWRARTCTGACTYKESLLRCSSKFCGSRLLLSCIWSTKLPKTKGEWREEGRQGTFGGGGGTPIGQTKSNWSEAGRVLLPTSVSAQNCPPNTILPASKDPIPFYSRNGKSIPLTPVGRLFVLLTKGQQLNASQRQSRKSIKSLWSITALWI